MYKAKKKSERAIQKDLMICKTAEKKTFQIVTK